MRTKLHIKVSNFIANPYVVRVDTIDIDIVAFRKLLKLCKNSTATWGYSEPEMELITSKDGISFQHNGVTVNLPNYFHLFRSYWLFSDDMDALQFRLAAGENAKQIHIWPKSIKFTITEFINDNSIET